MQKNKISLIGTTQGGREFEIERLLQSLSGSSDFLELIFVDQTPDTQVEEIVAKYKNSVTVKLIKSAKVSLSKARNLALAQATGNIFGFCDDDAFYNFSFLENLSDKEIVRNMLISYPIYDKESNCYYGDRKYPSYKKNISYLDIIKFSSSVGTFIFLKDSVTLSFNESLGVGAKYGGSEETELFFRAKALGFQCLFESTRGIYHDNDVINGSTLTVLSEKYRMYALGYALVIKKYMRISNFTLMLEVMNIILRSIGGVIISKKSRKLYLSRLNGFLVGLFWHKL